MVFNSDGLFSRANDTARTTEIKNIEELAKMSYMNRKIDEFAKGKNVTKAEVISDLQRAGYNVKKVTGETNNIIGIEVSELNIEIEKNTEKTVTYRLIYSDEENVRYFVEIQGKDYEIIFNNGDITVNTKETNIGELIEEPEIIVTSSNDAIIEANKTEEGKILLTSKNEIGDVKITVKETKTSVTKTFDVKIRIPIISLAVAPIEVTIMRGNTTKLTATLEPNNTTDKVIWSSSDESIATVSEDGNVTGVSIGVASITVKCGEFTKECKVTVEPIKLDSNILSAHGETLASLGCTWSHDYPISSGRYPSLSWYGFDTTMSTAHFGITNESRMDWNLDILREKIR